MDLGTFESVALISTKRKRARLIRTPFRLSQTRNYIHALKQISLFGNYHSMLCLFGHVLCHHHNRRGRFWILEYSQDESASKSILIGTLSFRSRGKFCWTLCSSFHNLTLVWLSFSSTEMLEMTHWILREQTLKDSIHWLIRRHSYKHFCKINHKIQSLRFKS